ncbi:MAG: hypothetical protein D6785_06435 [Planctomycetota bacterium]|nr:MAG: hypothetical protein D6785_06435 [Planctomycetota bacterium]
MNEGEGKYRDSLFARLVIRKKLLTKDQVETYLRETKKRQKSGESISLSKLLLMKGVLTDSQVKEIERFLEKEIILCPKCNAPYDAQKYSEGKEFTCRKCGEKIKIQKAYSDAFHTTIKFGAIPQNISDEDLEMLASGDHSFSKSPSFSEPTSQMPASSTVGSPTSQSSDSNQDVRAKIEADIQTASKSPEFFSAPTVAEPHSSDTDTALKEKFEDQPTKLSTSSFDTSSGKQEEQETTQKLEGLLPQKQDNIHSSKREEERGQEESEEWEAVESHEEFPHLPSMLEVQYYQRMNPGRLFLNRVKFQPIAKGGKVRVRVIVPGGISIPDYQDVLLSQGDPSAEFWTIPLLKQKEHSFQVQVWHNDKMGLSELPLKVSGRRVFQLISSLIILFLLSLGILFYKFQSLASARKNYIEQKDSLKTSLYWIAKTLSLKPDEAFLYTLIGLGAILVIGAIIFHFLTRAKKVELKKEIQYHKSS